MRRAWARSRRIALALALAGVTACSVQAPAGPGDRTAPTTAEAGGAPGLSLSVPRAVHRATRLLDGRVLVTGGCTAPGCDDFPAGQRSEIVDAAGQSSTPGAAMTSPRAGHTATLLPDGKVLLVGGYTAEGAPPTDTVEVYDPVTAEFTAAGRLSSGRADHTATALPDGRVLIAGGTDGRRALPTTQVYDPRTSALTAGPTMTAPRAGHAGVISGGVVLLVGGTTDLVGATATTEVLRANRWTAGPDLREPRLKHAAAALPGGRVLVVGGATTVDGRQMKDSTELLDRSLRTSAAGPRLSEPQYKLDGAVVALPDGRVVIAGGRSAEVFDPLTDALTVIPDRPGPRRSFVTATALAGGAVLVAGGYDASIAPTASARVVRLPSR